MNLADPLPLAQALIRCPSVTPDEAGALDLAQAWLESLGFTVWRLPFEGDGGARTDNLFARLGSGSPHLCFAGHVDVVPPGELSAWVHPPFSAVIEDGYLYGRGAEDMKGAIACFIAAVARTPLPSGSLSVLLTADEEGMAINGTRKAMRWMEANGHVPDGILVGEPTNPGFIGEMAKIGRRGSLNAKLTVNGRQGHVGYPHLADNPMAKIIRILHALQSHRLDEGMEFFSPSNLEVVSIDVGNPSDNVIPPQATARFNIRFNPLHQGEALIAWLHQTCKSHSADYLLQTRISGEAFLSPPGGLSALVTESIREVTGHMPALSTTGGTSDARFLRELCPVVEFGATGFTPHQVNERIKVDDLEILTQCYKKILKIFFQNKQGYEASRPSQP